MTEIVLADLLTAYDETVVIIQTIPDAALDWQPGDGLWSLKRIMSHLAHANDFYRMVVDQARATNFGDVRLGPELVGWQRMVATDAEVSDCTTTEAVIGCFECRYQELIAVLQGIGPEELDRPFVFYSQRPDVEPFTTTLRQRVIQQAAEHMREHHEHLRETVAQWRLVEYNARETVPVPIATGGEQS